MQSASMSVKDRRATLETVVYSDDAKDLVFSASVSHDKSRKEYRYTVTRITRENRDGGRVNTFRIPGDMKNFGVVPTARYSEKTLRRLAHEFFTETFADEGFVRDWTLRLLED